VGAYIIAEDIAARMGGPTSEAFLRTFDKDRDGVADTAVLDAAILSSETIINATLAASHGTPFTGTIPQHIKDIAVMLAPFEAVKFYPGNATGNPNAPHPFFGLWKAAMDALTRLATNQMRQLPSGAPAPYAQGLAYVFAPAAVWNAALTTFASAGTPGQVLVVSGGGGGPSDF
jgi:hypothetical protein